MTQPSCSQYSGRSNSSRVLVVDDEPAIRSLFGEALRQEFQVAIASTGEEALALIGDQPPDVLLTDKNLPGMSGLELLRTAKQASPQMACILITGHSSPDSAVEALRLGAFDYLIKPCDLRLAIQTVRRAAEHKTTERDQADDHARLERLVIARTRQLFQADRLAAIGQLAAGLAHEINNPACYVMANLSVQTQLLGRFRAALGELEGLARSGQDRADACSLAALLERHRLRESVEQLEETLRENHQGLDRIRSVARDLHTFSRLEAGEIELVDLVEVIRSAVNMVGHEIRHRGILELDLEALPSLPAHRAKLGQVMTNLLVNAAQAIPEGTANQHRIRVSARLRTDRIVLQVTDTGTGIEADQLEHIFEPFVAAQARGDGTGLGLALCRDIVRQHAGEIRATSQPGRGSCFEVELPIANGLQVQAWPAPHPEAPASSAGRGRVLIVDDDAKVLKTFHRVLSPSHDVSIAEGGQAGVDLLIRDRGFDLILCDLMMPNFDGPMFHQAVAELDQALADRIVYMSGGAFTLRVEDFVRRIANPSIPKPIDFGRLHDLVASFVARRSKGC
jgi:signal transduction histidine kinase